MRILDEEQVVRLEVAVNDPTASAQSRSHGDVVHDARRRRIEDAFAIEALGERLPTRCSITI
ncbi:MAG: hypothetical protein R3B72_42515 [Polyangiaceae bacterium]